MSSTSLRQSGPRREGFDFRPMWIVRRRVAAHDRLDLRGAVATGPPKRCSQFSCFRISETVDTGILSISANSGSVVMSGSCTTPILD